jgi:perosamine synthetase
MTPSVTRRTFVRTTAAAAALGAWFRTRRMSVAQETAGNQPALLGGQPAFRGSWPGWPQWREAWEPEIIKILRSGAWFRGARNRHVREFEAAYARLLGAQRCLATSSGTTALITSLHVAGVDAGDEVIVSPYTFIATYNAILTHKALPVFADTDPQTLNIDPATIESRITDRTKAILPVHIFGMPCDMDPILAVARKRELAVVEDACQAWLAEYRGQMCGTIGDLGCFSFQNSKHLTSGEGGAVTSNSGELVDRCQAYHDCGRATGTYQGSGYFTRGSNFRMQHFQAAMLLQQLDKLVEDTEVRRQNADYLTSQLQDLPGLTPAKLPENSRAVWHLYPLRYDTAQFHGLSRDGFLAALQAEGVPCSAVYHEQYHDGLLDEAIQSRGFQRLFGERRLKDYRDSFEGLTGNRQVCATTVALPQTVLLGKRSDMERIIDAVRKIQHHSEALAQRA